MKAVDCGRTWEAEAFDEGRLAEKDADSFARHWRTCASCAETLARNEHLRALGRALFPSEPAPLAVRRVRARILRDVAAGAHVAPPRSAWRLAAASVLVVAMVIGAVFVARDRAPTTATGMPVAAVPAPAVAPFAGTVSPSPGAVWTQAREQDVERVSLNEGTLQVHVRPQRPGERFLVVLPDGVIEVRGTTFEVAVVGGTTSRVVVSEGTVQLSIGGSPPRALGAGSQWGRDALAAAAGSSAASASSPVSAPPSGEAALARPTRPAAASAHAPDAAAAYADAMRLFLDGRYDGAAAAFHAFKTSNPSAPEAEDASFLEAVSLAKAGRSGAAALAAERHLEIFPRSFRRKEASILVARAASRRGDCERARAVLAPWSASAGEEEVHDALCPCNSGRACSP